MLFRSLATFWDRLGKYIWNGVVLPLMRFIWTCISVPVQLARIRQIVEQCKQELSEDSGKSMKDILRKNTEDTVKIRNAVEIINQRGRAALSISPHPHWEAARDGKVLWVNRSFTRMLSCTSEELIGWRWLDFVCDEDRERVRERYSTNMIHGEDFEMAFTMNRGGERVKVHAQAHVMRDSERSEPIGYMGMMLKEL